MNYFHFITFLTFVFSVQISGAAFYYFINRDKDKTLNSWVYLGETLLLGSIGLVGIMIILSLVHLYTATYLWGGVFLNFFFLLNKEVRQQIRLNIFREITFDIPGVIFFVTLSIFVFRNCYFMVDVDDHMTYLYTQKLWLNAKTSLIGDVTINSVIFVPMFDAVPYALGISLFGENTLFAQLINVFWRLIVFFSVFGYTSYRFNNRYYGLAAYLLILFNDHIFYSGANQYVIINAAVVALFFAAAYNFWEGRVQKSPFRFILALIFAIHIMANKYQTAFSFILLSLAGLAIQPNLGNVIKAVFQNKRYLWGIIIAVILTGLWYLKNYIVTGIPTFYVLAGKFGAFDWTLEQEKVFLKAFGGVTPQKFFKYMNYFFIWPGINASKYVILTISFFPFILLVTILRNRFDKHELLELVFWLGVCILVVLGICLATFWDPRYYRFFIGIFAFTAVLCVDFILRNCLKLQNKIILSLIILVLALPGYKIIFQQGGFFQYPTFKENVEVIFDRIHMEQTIDKYFTKVPIMLKGIEENKEKYASAAWLVGTGYNFPSFLLPVRPIVSLWRSTLIKWDSYKNEDLVVRDLQAHGINWIMTLEEKGLIFVPIEEYAKEAVQYDRYPKKILFDYGFPQELTTINY